MTANSAQDRRRHERYPIYCPLEYKAEDDQPKEPAITLNISENGALVSARRNLPINSNVILKFLLKDEMFFIIGKIRHIRQNDKKEIYEAGIEFWDKPRTFTKKFYDELQGIMEYQKRQKQELGNDISLAEASLDWYKDSANWPQ